jgi:hypothetical protein
VNCADTYPAVRACALALLAGAVLQADDVSAGRGMVVDWRSIPSGETLQEGADAFDTAQLFVALVGEEVALAACAEDAPEPAPPVAKVAPRVAAYMPQPNGGRRRSFEAGPFTVYVEPNEDDAAQALFTEMLAGFAVEIAEVAS